jgi:uncharacterized protein (TIGR02246 family)
MASSPKPSVVKRRDGRRAEVRGTAREMLLDSAAKVFAERGYRGTSVDLVAENAGVTKGALYWHFKNKEELFFALIDERVDRRARELMQVTETAPREHETAPTVSRGTAELVNAEPELILLTHEYWSLAVRQPQLLKRYVERQRSLTEALARALESRHETSGVPLTYPAGKLAAAIIALTNGLAMDRIADPEAVPSELLGETLALIYDGLVHRAEAGDRPVNIPRRNGLTAHKPEQLHTLFARHASAGDIDAALSLYEPDAVFVTPEGQHAVGTAAIRKQLHPILAMKPHLEMTTRYAVPAGDIALLSSHWRASFKPETGPANETRGTSTEIARRQHDGTWLYILDAPASIN